MEQAINILLHMLSFIAGFFCGFIVFKDTVNPIDKYAKEGILITVNQLDGTNLWYYYVYFPDLMCPYYEAYNSFKAGYFFPTYEKALQSAINKTEELKNN